MASMCYTGGAQAFHYYSKRYRLAVDDLVIGRCRAGNPRQYLRELDHFRGKNRLWVIVTASWRNGTEVALIFVPGSPWSASGDDLHTGLWRVCGRSRGCLLLQPERPQTLGTGIIQHVSCTGPVADPAGRWACYGVFQPDPGTR